MISDDGWVVVYDKLKGFSLYQHNDTQLVFREQMQLTD